MWLELMAKKIMYQNWWDALGEIYENCVVSKSKATSTGQFFTPPTVCDMMAQVINGTEPIFNKDISDPTCGSGRNLLAFNAINPGNNLYAEDIDKTSCLMTVANFLVHGIKGEVVWHDSLAATSWFGGWKVNEFFHNPFSELCNFPHMRPIEQCDSYIMAMRTADKVTLSGEEKEIKKPISETINKVVQVPNVQLSFWDLDY